MTTIKTMAAVSLLFFLASCSSWKEAKSKREERSNYTNPFYMQYLDPGNARDAEIIARVEALRVDPSSPALHNELGALLFEHRFTDDARREFKRALDLDKRFYPARYNLALVELADGNTGPAERNLRKVVRQKPGHSEAHFTLGLISEHRGRRDAAIEHYAKAYSINPELLQIKKNPRIVESQLVTASLLTIYDTSRARASTQFLDAPQGYLAPSAAATAIPESAPLPEPVVEQAPPAESAPVAPPPGR